jgi:hypothetical protein
MFKQSVRTLSIIAALFSMHTAASASCVGADCQVDITGSFGFTLGQHTNGIFVQNNRGSNVAVVGLSNLVMRDSGDITATANAIGNNINISLNETSTVPVRHISQSNYGNQAASVAVHQKSISSTGDVTLESVSIGNNLSLTLEDVSMSNFSVAQCNVSNNVASTTFVWDPTSLTAASTAVGNNISINAVRP